MGLANHPKFRCNVLVLGAFILFKLNRYSSWSGRITRADLDMQRSCPCVQCNHAVVTARRAVYHAGLIADGSRRLAPPEDAEEEDEDDETSDDSDASLSDANQHEDEEEEEEERLREPEMLDGFCMDMVDLIARGQVSVTGMDNVLKVLNKHIKMHLDPEIVDLLPHSMYTLRCRAEEIAGAAAGCRTFYRHFCQDCGEIFPAEPTASFCSKPGCKGTRYTNQGNPRMKALFYDIRDKLTRLARNGFLRSFLLAPMASEPEGDAAQRDLRDVFDGNIINELRKLWPTLHVLYVAMVVPQSVCVL